MKFENYDKIDDLSRKYALTNEQLENYLLLHDIDISNMTFDTLDKKISVLLNTVELTNVVNHNNKSGLKAIKVEGLFGKYNYSLEFDKDIIILISENGVGKTTLLTIIVAILTGDINTLYDIDFRRITINILGREFTIEKEATKDRIVSKVKNNKRGQKQLMKSRYESNFYIEYLLMELMRYLPAHLFIRLRNEIESNTYVNTSLLNEIQCTLMYDESINPIKVEQLINKIKIIQYRGFYQDVDRVKETLKEEVVFYPTYRRIEASIDKIFSSYSRKYRDRDLTSKYMDFGLRDVKARISNLLEKIRKDTNNAYIEMNANIISELLGTKQESFTNAIEEIDMHKIDVVINRIGEDRITNIEKLRSYISSRSNFRGDSKINFLFYYLQKLVNIYDSQAAIDNKLKKFAKTCSKYLVGKEIIYDETLLSIGVYDDDGVKIDFDQLSSGEKQIISIFSKVYLDVISPCIFIIDEPEISLSIEWQKQFLKDIYDSKKIALLIATTHSPFIFKNEYIDYVKELDLYKENCDDKKR